MNNSSNSLFTIPANKRFVYFNTDDNIREDPLLKKMDFLKSLLEKSNAKDDDKSNLSDLRPFRGFGKPLAQCKPELDKPANEINYAKQRQFISMLRDHVEEAMDSVTKYKGRNHFTVFNVLNIRSWYEAFKMLHKIFIENPDNPSFEANDSDYKMYLKNFDKIINIDEEFFAKICDIDLQRAYAKYNNPALTHYSGDVHKKMVQEAVVFYYKHAVLMLKEMSPN